MVAVIEVLRAFTAASYAFSVGAQKIIMVKTKEQAFFLKKEFSEAILLGEEEGNKIPEFDWGNSPWEISKKDLKGKILIQIYLGILSVFCIQSI